MYEGVGSSESSVQNPGKMYFNRMLNISENGLCDKLSKAVKQLI